jgi:aquaporin Z
MNNSNTRIAVAETIGTGILMLGGPGTAVLAGHKVGVLGISLGFGLALLVVTYTLGPISGGHVNPAVTLGMALMNKIERATVPFYLAGQVAGALVGGGVIYVLAQGNADIDQANFATNMWGAENGFSQFSQMVVAEVAMTALLMFTVLSTTSKRFAVGFGGLTIGLVFTLIHLISIPIDNTSANPVRSIGMAVWGAGSDTTPLEQLWAFVVFPAIGAIVGAVLWTLVDADAAD